MLGAVLGHSNQACGADDSPGSSGLLGVAEEEVVFGGGEELRAAGVALAGGSAEELAVDSIAGGGLGGDDVEAADFGGRQRRGQ